MAKVDCDNCGIVELTHENYMYQLSAVDSVWKCPHCRQQAEFIDEDVDFDDDNDDSGDDVRGW